MKGLTLSRTYPGYFSFNVHISRLFFATCIRYLRLAFTGEGDGGYIPGRTCGVEGFGMIFPPSID